MPSGNATKEGDHIRSFIIPGKPVGKGRPRFTKSGRVFTPKSTVDYEKAVREAYMAKYGDAEPYDGEVILEIDAFWPIPKSDNKVTKRKKIMGQIRPIIKPDIDNICKIIMDAINGLAYLDDKQVVSVSAKKWYLTDPQVRVFIRETE